MRLNRRHRLRLLQAANLIAATATIALNGWINAKPLNGVTTGQVSDSYPSLFTPPGWVFALCQARPRQRSRPYLQRIGWLHVVSSACNVTWLVVFRVFVARRLGDGKSTPLLVTSAGTFPDSTEILEYVDGECAAELRLYPDEPEQRRHVEQLEEWFDEDLGPAARRLVYYHLLDEPLIYSILTEGVGRKERALFRFLLPLCRRLMKRGLRINTAGAERSRARIENVFEEVGRLLKDGRRYLAGDRFSAADLTFAALAVPLLFPVEYSFPMPPFEALPESLRAEIPRCRVTPAGKFGLRIYAEERCTD